VQSPPLREHRSACWSVVPSADGRQATPAAVPPTGPTGSQQPPLPPSTIDDTIAAGEADTEEPARRFIRWNEYEGPFFTIRVGGALLYEFADYARRRPPATGVVCATAGVAPFGVTPAME
jgi:hypothetical protein